MRCRWWAVALLCCAVPLAAQTTLGAGPLKATVSGGGDLASLAIDGVEWLGGKGFYFYQGKVLTLTKVERQGDGAVLASADFGSVRYEFSADGGKWQVTNATDQPMEFVGLFAAPTHAGNGQDEVAKLPGNFAWPTSTWFVGQRRLTISGGTRLWGPFADKLEVWHCTLAAKEARTITLTLGTASPAEAAAMAGGPKPAGEAGGRVLAGQGHATTIGDDGCVTSLKVGATEFFTSAKDFPRGGYFYQGGIVKLATVAQPQPGLVTADGEKAAARYEIGATGQTWSLTNKTDKPMLFVVVMDPAIGAVCDAQGHFAKPPTERPWTTVTWFSGAANLTMSGGTRIWGPWNEKHAVWETSIAPGGATKVEVKVGAATAEQVAQAQKVATAPRTVPRDPEGPMWDLQRFAGVPRVWPAEGFDSPDCRPVFFEGPDYQGKPTKVFAWIGLPKVPAGTKVPGMVLVHGGGGTAFDAWVRRWTSRGYAAIAMDTCGAVPKGEYGKWQRGPEGGPPGWGGWGQIDDPREDQWTFHAVASALLAHSLLRSLPEVDADRVGLTGISWGGYLACILAGVDSRLKCVVPVYGCGFTNEHSFAGSVAALGPERAARWMRWWDPSVYLPKAAMPMCWVTGTNDFAYTFNALQKSYRLPTGPRTLCIRLRMPHGHGDAGEGPAEIFAFADSVLKAGDPLAKVGAAQRDGLTVSATVESKHPIRRAELCYTKDRMRWPDRKWDVLPAKLEDGRLSATLPEGVSCWYLNVFDDRDLAVSTEHQEIPAG